jgi:N-acyl-D-aspartate/D-glutamate deacylase
VFDLVLSGGTVCDGTGAPARTADVAIAGGRIAAVGRADGAARRTIDVAGLVVAPGFVDVHTHYDAQVTWDGGCTPSPWHGVTSVVLGNCGFGLAPCRPDGRERLLRMLEHVEGMPYASLVAGVPWNWESFADYLAMLRARPLGPNVGVLLAHSTLRAHVMGDDAYVRAAREDEVAAMRALVADGMAAGALGLATSRSTGHVGEAGRPVPSRQASREELGQLVLAMASNGRGVLEITPETFPIAADELAWLQTLARESGRPVSFSAALDLPDRPDVWEPVYAALRAGRATGAVVLPQVSCRPMQFDFDLDGGCSSLDAMPSWRRWRAAASPDARVALARDADFRASVRADALGRPDAPSSRRWADVVLAEAARPEHQVWLGHTLSAIARERGGDVIDALLDVSVAEGLRARFTMTLLNYDDARVGALLRQPESLVALSDAGAHVSVLCDAGYATHFLGYWVRERGALGLEDAVRRLTSMPASLYGIPECGRLAPDAVADIACFDATRVACRAPELLHDFPGGAARFVTRADGVHHVLVAGVPVVDGGVPTDARPGRVLESG